MNYYNENDPKAAAWLRELIRVGLIPDGFVDERSILDVRAADLARYCQCHFFAGIGGWSLALRLAGVPDDAEIDSGSCPCQPFSGAGLGLGSKDPRHLFPAFRRLIARRASAVVVGEQVASKDGREWLARVRLELETLGYGVRASDLCSASVGSPNIRQRLFWMADADGGQSRHGGVQPRGQYRQQQQEDSGAGGLAHVAQFGRGEGPGQPREINRAGSGEFESAEHGVSLRLVSADAGRRRLEFATRLHDLGERWNDLNGRGTLERLVDAIESRLEGLTGNVPRRRESGWVITGPRGPVAPAGDAHRFWAGYDIALCTDGKARRIEPRSFPLAHGIPGRVGLLRGYGNAINPYLAAEFIQACLT